MRHGVNRGLLKEGKFDDRINFLRRLTNQLDDIHTIFMGIITYNQYADNFMMLLQTVKWV